MQLCRQAWAYAWRRERSARPSSSSILRLVSIFFSRHPAEGRAGQQLFPCYRLTGRETRKKGKRCVVKTWGSSACLPLLPLYFAPSSSACPGVAVACGLHACDYMFLASKAGGTHRYHIRASRDWLAPPDQTTCAALRAFSLLQFNSI